MIGYFFLEERLGVNLAEKGSTRRKSKMRKGTGSRILAYVLALCMIIGSITWPSITAKAETITLDLKPDTSWQTMTAATDEWSDYGKAEHLL